MLLVPATGILSFAISQVFPIIREYLPNFRGLSLSGSVVAKKSCPKIGQLNQWSTEYEFITLGYTEQLHVSKTCAPQK
jgi:hypothetical protein